MTREVMIMRRRIGAAFLLGIVVIARSGCAALNGPQATLAEGDWGGDHLRLRVGADGASFEFDCAHGRLNAPIRLLDNEFVSTGWFRAKANGPIHEESSAAPKRARYHGRIARDRMTLDVLLIDEARVLGTYHLKRGSNGRVTTCL